MTDISIQYIDEASVALEFSSKGIERELSDIFTFEVPGAKFSPQYRRKHWDGKIRLYDSHRQRILAGLTPQIHEFARARNYTISDTTGFGKVSNFSIQDAANFAKTLDLPVIPRDYQIEALQQAVSRNRCIIVSPTQSGKSLIAYMIYRYFKKKTLIVVPTTSLVTQLHGDFEDYGYTGRMHTIMAGRAKFTTEDVTISTWQSIYEQPPEFFEGYEVIIGDEAHLYKAKSLMHIMNSMPKCKYRIGMTGTLDGSLVNELILRGLFGHIEKVATTEELMKRKQLAQLHVTLLILNHPMEECKKLSTATYPDEIKYLVECTARNKFIKNLALKLKGNTLVLYDRVDTHGKILYEDIKAKHPNTHFVAGEVDVTDREDIRALIKTQDDVITVASYGTFQHGINMPRLNNIIFASSTKSRIRTLQSIGRGLALGEGKTTCNLFDISDNLGYYGHMNFTYKHMIERVKMYIAEGFPYEQHSINLGRTIQTSGELFPTG